MYAGCKTSVMTSAGTTKYIEIEVGLHQGLVFSPLLFVIIIDVVTEEIEEGTPWGNAVRGRPGVVRSWTWCCAILVERWWN